MLTLLTSIFIKGQTNLKANRVIVVFLTTLAIDIIILSSLF
jgi:hypothetical protein